MNDPYQILGVSETASDEEDQKRHIGSWPGSTIRITTTTIPGGSGAGEDEGDQRRLRADHQGAASGKRGVLRRGLYGAPATADTAAMGLRRIWGSQSYSGQSSVLQQARIAINTGNISRAEALLANYSDHNAGVELPEGGGLLPPGLAGRGAAVLPDRLPDGPHQRRVPAGAGVYGGHGRHGIPPRRRPFGTLCGGNPCMSLCCALCALQWRRLLVLLLRDHKRGSRDHMIKSMTGYGRARQELHKRDITGGGPLRQQPVSGLHREDAPDVCLCRGRSEKQLVQQAVSPGKVDVFITVDATAADVVKVTVNRELAAQYAAALGELADVCGTADYRPAPETLARFPDVLTVTKADEDLETVSADLCAVLDEALAAYNDMRAVEGQKLAEDISNRLDAIERYTGQVEDAVAGDGGGVPRQAHRPDGGDAAEHHRRRAADPDGGRHLRGQGGCGRGDRPPAEPRGPAADHAGRATSPWAGRWTS